MPEKNKREKENKENAAEKSDKEDSPTDEQKKSRYYYDDGHGYEVYKPVDDDEDD